MVKRTLFLVVLYTLVLSVIPAFSALQSSAKGARKTSSPNASATSTKVAAEPTKASKKKSGAKTKSGTKRKSSKAELARLRRISRTFVASATLKPMARQLLQARTKAAYAGVEAYARKHAKEDVGGLAYLAIGYARILDRDYAQAIPPLKKAQVHAGDLGDYVAYFLASAYGGSGQAEQTVATLRNFDERFPDSVFLRDAMTIYGNALVASGATEQAIAVLEKHRAPVRADIELALGRAYVAAGNVQKGGELLRHLWLTMPSNSDATEARADLDKVESQLPPLTFEHRRLRADALALARRQAEAAREYAVLLPDAPPEQRTHLEIAYGVALHRSGNDEKAREVLSNTSDTGDELGAQRALAMVEASRSAQDEQALHSWLGVLREKHTSSPAFEDALLVTANMYLIKRDYDRAIDHFRELQQRFPQGRRGSYAHWKTAWLSLRQGRSEEARKLFEEQIDWYPNGAEVAAALYWRARLAEEDRDLPKAFTYYSKVNSRFRQYYYAVLARERLKGFDAQSTPLADPLLEKVPPIASVEIAPRSTPEDELRYNRARLLMNGGMLDLAARELRNGSRNGGASWATVEIARMYQDASMPWRAIDEMKRAVPAYFAVEIEALPREYWEALFPRPYWPDVRRNAVANRFDPYLVASLIRQESAFNPGAISRANALGLMQVLPDTGKGIARSLKIRRFRSEQLFSPTTNLQIGTRYFRLMVDKFDGQVEYALAAYNAGSNRVEDWLKDGKYRGVDEFVESIPFTETREYVQAIMRNAAMYEALYGMP